MFDTGSTGFMLIATSLVMLMTPGLAFSTADLLAEKCSCNNDSKFCFSRLDDCYLVRFRIFTLL